MDFIVNADKSNMTHLLMDVIAIDHNTDTRTLVCHVRGAVKYMSL